LFLEKSAKTASIIAALLTPICTKSFVGWGFAPDPTGGAYSVPQTPAVFRGPISKGRGDEGRGRGGERRGGRGKVEKEMVGREFALCPRNKKETSAPIHKIHHRGHIYFVCVTF